MGKLEDIYYDVSHPAGFSSVNKLYEYVKDDGYSRKQIIDWLKAQEPYTLHRSLKRNFRTNRVVVSGISELHDLDLADMRSISEYNDNYKYLLVMIDCFSRYAWVKLLKNKSGNEVTRVMGEMLNESRIPSLIRVDRGSEINNKQFDKLMLDHNIHKYKTSNIQKANYAERFIKTLKSRIYRYFSYKQNYRYIDVLQDIVKAYNASKHSALGIAPKNVTKQNEREVWWKLYWPKKEYAKQYYKFKVGDKVRISYLKKQFMRAYDQTFTGEIFIITSRFKRNGIPIYHLKDYNDQIVFGTFYQQELQLVIPPTTWKVSKILKTRKKGKNKEHLVRWLHFPPAFDSWIKSSDVENI